MNPTRRALLQALAQFGQENDCRVTLRAEKMLNITPDTGSFLAILVQAMQAHAVLEIGTSNGYSTIWLADAAQQTTGHVTTLEAQEDKSALARQNFQQAEVADVITLVASPAQDWLVTQAGARYDFIFLDADRTQYVRWWPWLYELLLPGGLLVVDNAVSHQAEIAEFTALARAKEGIVTSLVPIGNGELLLWKSRS